MNNKDIEWRRKKLEQERKKLESGQLNALRELLPDEVIGKICEECAYDFRARLLTPLVIIFHMISAGISREGSFRSAWHLAGQNGKSGSLAKGRQRLPLEVWGQLHEWTTRQIKVETAGENLWRGHRIVGTDGTCISMPDEAELVNHFGRCNTRHGFSRFPLARMTLVFDLNTLVTLHHEAGPYETDETELLRSILPRLQHGDVLVGDRHFAGANHYAEYLQNGVEFITRAHQALQVEALKAVRVFNSKDKLVELQINPQHRRKNPALPESIVIRVIQTTVKNKSKKETFWIATSLLDPRKYPAHEIQTWLKKRWKVETLIEEIKIWMGADILRSKTVAGIDKELQARIIGLNLIHWLIVKASRKNAQEVDRVSVSAALRLAVSYSLKMSTAPAWQLPLLYEELLERIASSKVPYRPDRSEPRMIKRETKYYPMLKISRTEWRNLYAVAA